MQSQNTPPKWPVTYQCVGVVGGVVGVVRGEEQQAGALLCVQAQHLTLVA